MDPSRTTVVVGGPGSGKTTRLLGYVEQALASGIKPHRIGYTSFTKKAVEEARQRASVRFSLPEDDFPHFRTWHSFAFRHLGMSRDRTFSWQHTNELGKMLGMEFHGKGASDDEVYGMGAADRMMFLDGLARNRLEPLRTTWERASEDIDWFELERFSRSLVAYKRSRGVRDYTDMIEQFIMSPLSSLPKLDLLVVDEVQDTSSLQWRAVEMLASNSAHTIVGGDDRQAIYSWSGANVDAFIYLKGEQIQLDQSWRIPASVHRLAESIAAKMQHKRPQSFKPRPEEGAIHWHSDVGDVDLSSGTWMLLARNGYLLTELENYCLQQGFSFNSINRDPLKSPTLKAIRTWEDLRRGRDCSAEQVLACLKYVDGRWVTPALVSKLRSDEESRQYGIVELQGLGLGTTAIWHESLSKISPVERDYFLAVRRRGEKLLSTPRISISTIHSAKGGQAENVLLLTDMSLRCFKNMEQSLDDELRVWYVGTTRCIETLQVVSPRTDLHFEL